MKIGLSFENKISSFDNELKQIAEKRIEEFLLKISRSICKRFKSSTRSLFADCFGTCSKDFWNDLETKFIAEIADSLDEFDGSCETFLSTEILGSVKNDLEGEIISIYREILLSESSKSTMILRFTKIMDKNFRFDCNGRPRHWESLSMIDEAYDKATNKVNFI